MQEHKCPITNRPLPAGYFIHPTLANDIEQAAETLRLIMPEVHHYMLGLTRGLDNETHTQPTSTVALRDWETITTQTRVLHKMTSIVAKHTDTPIYYEDWEQVAYLHAGNAQMMCRHWEAHGYYRQFTIAVETLERVLDYRHSPRRTVACVQCGEPTTVASKTVEFTCRECWHTQTVDEGHAHAVVRANTILNLQRLSRRITGA